MTSTSPASHLFNRLGGRAMAGARRCVPLACVSAVALIGAPSAQASSFFSRLSAEMTEPRESAVAAALPDGDVLIAGGYNGSGWVQTAEVFDPLTATFTPLTGRMASERVLPAAAVLPAGEGVLIAGGASGRSVLKSAEIFNPISETFEPVAGEMAAERYMSATATLPDGKVLIAGGTTGYVDEKTAEVFDPATETFEPLTGEMTESRVGAATASLPDGEVLILGGLGEGIGLLRTAELFDPATNTFDKLSAEMTIERDDPVAVLLPDGEVLIAGGGGGTGRTAELFDPATATFEKLSAETVEARDNPVAAALPGGNVFIAGGSTPSRRVLRSAEEVSDLAPAAQIAGGGFGDVTVGEPSALQTFVVNSVGASNLSIAGAALSGAQAGAFNIEQDTCTGIQLEFRQVCTIGVSFTPTSAGTVSATLTLADNEPVPSAVTLSGTGVPASGGSTVTTEVLTTASTPAAIGQPGSVGAPDPPRSAPDSRDHSVRKTVACATVKIAGKHPRRAPRAAGACPRRTRTRARARGGAGTGSGARAGSTGARPRRHR